MRPLVCEVNFASDSEGSVFLSQGTNKVLVSVDIVTTNENVRKPHVVMNYVHKTNTPSATDRYKENVIKQTCENVVLRCLPYDANVSITVQEKEDGSGLLSCAINGSCLALINAGVEPKCLFAAITCSVNADGSVVLDPTAEQLADSRGQMTFAFDSRDRSLIKNYVEGIVNEEEYDEALYRSRASSEQIFRYYGMPEYYSIFTASDSSD